MFENWVDSDYVIVDSSPKQKYHSDPGDFISNPIEYKTSEFTFGEMHGYRYDPEGVLSKI